MIRLTLLATFFILLINKQQLDAALEFYGQPAYTKQQHRSVSLREFSPTYMQSRHFHPDQFSRDNRDLKRASSVEAAISYSYYYSYGGPGSNLAASSQEACRLTDTICSHDYQCCRGKCRCVRWSVTGAMSCYKKCF